MIERVYIDNFRCFSNFELRLDRINLLLGPNGSGKSSLFDVLAGVAENLGAPGPAMGHRFAPDDLTRWDKRAEQRIELDVRLDGARYTYRLRLAHDRDDYSTTLIEEAVECDGDALFVHRDGQVHLHRDDGSTAASFPYRGSHSFLSEMEMGSERQRLAPFLQYMRSTCALRLMPPQLESVTHGEQAFLHRSGDNFASWYRHLAQERAGELHELFEDIRRALPGFRSLALLGAGGHGRTRDLVARFDSPGSGPHDLELDALSDGQRALIVLYTLLVDLRSGARLVLLDEPENYVGLTEIRPWLHSLDDALGEHGQLLLISHHPEVIDELAAERPLLFERVDGGPVRVRTDIFSREEGLTASEQLLRGFDP